MAESYGFSLTRIARSCIFYVMNANNECIIKVEFVQVDNKDNRKTSFLSKGEMKEWLFGDSCHFASQFLEI